MADPAVLHRWAGNRLLLLPLSTLAIATSSFLHPALGAPLLVVFIAVILAVAIWVVTGSEKFCGRR